MNLDINHYLSKAYERPPCWDLLADVMHAAHGPHLTGHTGPVSSPGDIRKLATTFRLTLHRACLFCRLEAPADLCIVLLGKTPKLGIHHCGVFWRGSVLHACPEGNRFENLSVMGDQFRAIEFWGLR